MGEGQARVRLVRTRDGQRLDIPEAFAIAGDEAVLRMDGTRLVVEPADAGSLLAVLDGLDDLDDDWPLIEDAPPEAVRL
jgi:antitoxin VapB